MSWIELVRNTLRMAEAACDGLQGTRNAVLGLWLAIDRAPANVRDLFRGFPEEELQEEAESLSFSDCFRVPSSSAQATIEMAATLRWLAVRLRALESLLYSVDAAASTRDPASCLATFEGRSAYLLLREPAHRRAKTGESFHRRGLRRARIFPTKVEGFDVKLVFVEDPRGLQKLDRGLPVRAGAGLFQDLKMTPQDVPGGFIIADAEAPSQLDVMRDQIERASADACMSVIYPELSVTKATASVVGESISNSSWECALSFLIAGTHHSADSAGRWFNVAAIFDGYGNVLDGHKKLFRFNDKDGPHEAIEFGTSIHIFVIGQAVLAVGICLDFCNLAESCPYPRLDVDYVMVPSCGGKSTMEGHIRRSGELIEKLKSRTMVVQQYYDGSPKPEDPLGYVLARTSKSSPALEDLAQTNPWTICTL